MKVNGGALALALCVSVVYALPQIVYLADGHHDALIQALDEAPYVARVQEVMNGHWRAVDPYLWESKRNQFLLPYGAEIAIGLPARLVGADIDATIIAVRFLAPALLALALFRFFLVLTKSTHWSLVGVALTMLEPGTYYSQPFHYLTHWSTGWPAREHMPLLYTRFHNPLVLALPFVLAAAAVYQSLAAESFRRIQVAGFLVGVNFYTQLFYWAYLYAGLTLLAVWYWREKRSRSILAIAGLGLLWGSVAIVEQVLKSSTLSDPELFARGGLLFRTHAPIFLMPKGLLLIGLAFVLLYRRDDLRRAFLLCFLAGGYGLLNQNVVTGRELQNYHFNYPNAIVSVAALVLVAQERLHEWSRMLGMRHWRLASRLALAAVLVWLVANAAILQAESYSRRVRAGTVAAGQYPSNLKQPFRRTLEWISAGTETDAVFLADDEVSFLIPIYTAGNVFLDPLQNDHTGSFVSEEELFDRWMIQLKLDGASAGEVFERTRYRPEAPFIGWGFGRNAGLMKKYRFTDLAAFDGAVRSNQLAHDYVEEYRRFATDDISSRLARYRVDYLVTARDQRFAESSRRYLADRDLIAVAEIPEEHATIYELRLPGRPRP